MAELERKKIVLIGGGHTHALVLKALIGQAIENADVYIIHPQKTAMYSGMLPGFVAGHYERHELEIDIEHLAQKAGVNWLNGRASSLDISRKIIGLENGRELAYDIASFDIGVSSELIALPGFVEFGVPVKPVDHFVACWEAFRRLDGPKHVAVIGGGVAGAELALAMMHALRGEGSVTLLDHGQVLSGSSRLTRQFLLKELCQKKISVLHETSVVEITSTGLALMGGHHISASFVLGAAGAVPYFWLSQSGLELHKGFVVVDKTLQSSESGIFAVGDCAHLSFNPRPKAGVYAVRQAPVLLKNIKNMLTGSKLHHYSPQSDYLKLISLGDKRAFGEKFGCGASGHLIWWLKDRIDRSFMNQF